MRAKVKHLEATTARINNEKQDYNTEASPEDQLALDMLGQLALVENANP